MRTNRNAVNTRRTHNGAPAKSINAKQELMRSVLSCMLWEDEFYESGETIATRIERLVGEVDADFARDLAISARNVFNLRHVPLLIARVMAKLPTHKHLVADTLCKIVKRPDELTEFLAIYWKDGKQPLSAQVKKGLAIAMGAFDEYSLAKYNRDTNIKLKDVAFLVHAGKGYDYGNGNQAKAIKRSTYARGKTMRHPAFAVNKLINDSLSTPDTWEVAISAISKNDKDARKAEWTRLMKDRKLGGLAFLRNLRNMVDDGLTKSDIARGLAPLNVDRVLPFRFISASRAVPQLEDILETKMFEAITSHRKLEGKTILLVDVSGSMNRPMSDKSDLRRKDGAYALAILLREICEDVEIYSFSNEVKPIAPRHGFALRDALDTSQGHNNTYLGKAVSLVANKGYDRLIVFTDEQSDDAVPNPVGRGYMLNVASAQNGVGYGEWVHIDGFSEACVEYIAEVESNL